MSDLFGDGARSLLYYEVPDLAVVPAFSAAGALASQLSMEFNEGVLNGLKPLEAQGLTVFDLPVYSDVDHIVADPATYGLTNVTTAPAFPGTTTPPARNAPLRTNISSGIRSIRLPPATLSLPRSPSTF